MFSLQICRYLMSKLIIEVLKMVKEYKIYQNKGSPAPWDLTKVFAWGGGDLAVYENLPRGMIALGTD